MELTRSIEFKKRRQILFALVGILLAVIIFFNLKYDLRISWLFGLLVGFVLQRSRICFTAALRDPFLFGLTKLSRALILSLIVASAGFLYIQLQYQAAGLPVPGKFVPLGWHIPAGAFIFGLGAAISGGCASGTLVRLGEGAALQWIVVIGFTLGTIHGAYDASWWYRFFAVEDVYLPKVVGKLPGIIFHFIGLILLYLLAYYWEKRNFQR